MARRLDEAAALKIKKLKVSGLNAYPESWRYYPFDNLAAHILGFVGYKNDKLVGRYGLELYYEPMLKRDALDSKINSFAELFLI